MCIYILNLYLFGLGLIVEGPLGKPSCKKSAVFFNIVQQAFDPPLSFEHHMVNFSEGILTKLRKRLSQQLSKK